MLVRKVVVGVALVVMGVGIWLLWPRNQEPATTTVPIAAETTTTTTTTVPVTTTLPTTTTTTVEFPRVVETVEEAEAVLRTYYLGWFEGIYHEDEDRIREVVATDRQVEVARDQFGVMDFSDTPAPGGITFSLTEILRSDEECLAIWARINVEFREVEFEQLQVFRRSDNTWVLLSSWLFKEDLWEQDCEAVLQ